MKSQDLKKYKIPDKSGVYYFLHGKEILYIGKATSLKDRVKSYFGKDIINTRGPLILDMVFKANAMKYEETDSVLEALILEANLIKKYQPKYNTKEKDNKSFNYVCITREELPQVLVVRGRNVANEISSKKYQATYGPFPNGMQLRTAMKIIRRIFPYIDAQSSKKNNTEFYKQLGLTPNVFRLPLNKGEVGKGFLINSEPHPNPLLIKERENAILAYKKNIANLKLFFQGKKKKIILNLKKDMKSFAKKYQFEKAGEIKKRIFALEHINDVALIKEDILMPEESASTYRIEAYDIAHMSGQNMVGVMTVVIDGEVAKNEYKKFIIRTQSGSNDTGALLEVLTRRLKHAEWGMPDLIAVDGSTAQINVAKKVLNSYKLQIPIVSVVKDDRHKAKAIMGNEAIIKTHKKSILLANSEAHRFAIAFHKQKRGKNFLLHNIRHIA